MPHLTVKNETRTANSVSSKTRTKHFQLGMADAFVVVASNINGSAFASTITVMLMGKTLSNLLTPFALFSNFISFLKLRNFGGSRRQDTSCDKMNF
jgi:hypothetical protein